MSDINFPEWTIFIVEKDFLPDEIALLKLVWDVDLSEELEKVGVQYNKLTRLLIEVLKKLHLFLTGQGIGPELIIMNRSFSLPASLRIWISQLNQPVRFLILMRDFSGI